MTAYSIACLAGDGIGPEVMAQASRGMSAAARLHGFALDEEHVPFGADATMRVGHPFPLASRNTALAADAILAAPIDQTLLQALEGELDLRAAVMRVRLRDAAITFVAPLDADAWEWTLERAIATARASRGHLTFVGSEDGWAADVAAAGRDNCLGVTHLSTRSAIRALASNPDVFDVVVCDRPLLVPLAEVAWCLDSAARARLGQAGRERAGHLRAEPRNGRGHRRPGRRRSELDAARGRADARRRPRRAGRGGDALLRGLVRARQRRAARRRHGLDEHRADRRRARSAAAVALQRRVLHGGRLMLMNGADALLRSLEAEGVDTVFGIPGGAILPTYDALARGTSIRHVLARHEQGAGHMAQGYARASGRVGVAFATSGPGATNLVTPIADAWMDSTPLVCVTGQVRSQPDRHGRLPGVRHHRDHDPDRQALVARPGRGRAAARDQGRLPRRQHRALRAGARGHPARHPGGGARLQLPGRGRPARLAPRRDA